ncbi:hypothetical protein LVD17_28150 [Fulvivirga ulvae]|uniref:hypothetical protein n=1 Tax=Fulvivirga ulvae TaxID=2904245 RepID=UPI001F237792|nr:hypothetical protein [Fulvivirga ulvae]UII32161.1 hypothetical protein LVD17_28150 [Fulvivirga ulvae]
MNENDIIQALRKAFSNDHIKRQVLDIGWYEKNIESGIDSTGFCFAASEVLYRLTGASHTWQVNYLQDPDHWNQGTHYFLWRRNEDGEVDKANYNHIKDITADQYTLRNIDIPYEQARARGLPFVSRRARLLARLSGLGEL